MANKKPTLERINPGPENSVFIRQTSKQRTSPLFWHFNPELELVYLDKGEGRRHIGNHLSYFHNSDRIEVVYKHINHNFGRAISLDEISDLASMTVPAFCRYFIPASEVIL